MKNNMETTKETKIPKRQGMRGLTKIPLETLIDYLKQPENANIPRMDAVHWMVDKGLSQTGGAKKIELAINDGLMMLDKKTDRLNLTRAAFRV